MLRGFILASLLTAPALAQTPDSDGPERANDSGDRVICKRFTETGSLAKQTKVCKTKREWERERDNLRTVNHSAGCGKTDGTC